MSNDDRLVPRDYPIPVSVRRPLGAANASPLDPTLLPPQSPAAAPPSAPSPHIIYINNMPAPAAPAAFPGPVAPSAVTPFVAPFVTPAAPAQTIHHHHYNTPQPTQRISVRMRVPPSHSALGMASLALGIIACVVCWVPWLGLIAVPVAAIGTVLGVLGVLVSLLFQKSSAGLPLSGIFICCLAAGISIASTRTLPFWQKQLETGLSTVLPKGITLPQAITPPRTASPAPPPPPPPLPTGGLFDFPDSPAAPAAPQAVAPKPVPSPPPAVSTKLNPRLAAARDQLTAAESACDQRTMQSAAYQSAVKAAADARSRETLLRQTLPSGSADLIQAGQDMIKADNAVSDTLTQAQASDPDVIAAREALSAARTDAH